MSELHTCEVCHAKVPELRRKRCWGCYTAWVEAKPIGTNALCTFCGERRREVLRQVELLRQWVVSCHNCAALALPLSPMPQSLDELRIALVRERRDAERRAGRGDSRVFRRERRGLERRGVGREFATAGGELALEDDDILIVIDESELVGDETRIVAIPR